MPKTSNNRRAAIQRVEITAQEYRELAAALRALRVRRDFSMIACHRLGIPVRQIAEAAGLHPSRVQQLVAEANVTTASSGLKPLRPRKGLKKGRAT